MHLLPCRSLPPDYTFGSRPGPAGGPSELQGAGMGAAGALQHTLYGGHAGTQQSAAYADDSTTGLGKSLHEGWRNTAVPGRVSWLTNWTAHLCSVTTLEQLGPYAYSIVLSTSHWANSLAALCVGMCAFRHTRMTRSDTWCTCRRLACPARRSAAEHHIGWRRAPL